MQATVVRKPVAEPQAQLRLTHRADGQLWATRGEEEHAVRVRRAFPWSEPGRFISLRDAADREFALVAEPRALDAESREALEAALEAAGFVFVVTAVTGIEEEVEIRAWRVTTRQGVRTFQTRLDEWPRPLPGGGLLIRDVAGDLYRIDDLAALDAKSRELLWAYVD
ncbi:MAG TPA: DUF1854 domain-containing protein [Gemmatimonadales bacterium]|nr:DUF1854 domain-containing protein [Gemmatimonadales bacterium]